jgi:CheY-like chemotaxis protein
MEALAKLLAQDFALILLDMSMPGMRGSRPRERSDNGLVPFAVMNCANLIVASWF